VYDFATLNATTVQNIICIFRVVDAQAAPPGTVLATGGEGLSTAPHPLAGYTSFERKLNKTGYI
jgi:hypothetical protein